MLPEFFHVSGPGARLQLLLKTGRYQFYIIGVGLLITVYLIFGGILGQYWTADDPPLLASIVHNGIWRHFYDPVAWAYHLPEPPMWGVFTPWVMLSMGIDLWLGGLDPHIAYFHQLLSFWVAIFLLYAVLKRFFTTQAALYACLIFAVTPPARESAHYLMERHYIEGLALLLGSFLLYGRAFEKGSGRWMWAWACASALLYLAACLAKEIYAPLAALLPLMPWGSWRRRWVMLVPHALAGMIYILCRSYMLSPEYMIGYGGGHIKIDFQSWLNIWNVGLILNRIAAPWQKAILSLSGLLVMVFLGRSLMGWLRALALLALVVLPLYPMLDMLQIRLYFLPCLALIIGQAFVLDSLIRKSRWRLPWIGRNTAGSRWTLDLRLMTPIVGVLYLLLFLPSFILPHQTISMEALKRFRQEGEHALRAKATEALVHPTSWPLDFWWYFTGLSALRQEILHVPAAPPICYDPCVCSRLEPHSSRKFGPNGEMMTLWPVSHDAAVCGDTTSPLVVNISLDESKGYPIMEWKLGPYGNAGYYELLMIEKSSRVTGFGYPVRPKGKHPVGHGRFVVRVRWLSFEGWSTVSPPFSIAPGMQPIHWLRQDQEQ